MEKHEEEIEFFFTVPTDRHGWRLDRFLSDRIPRLSRTKIRRIIEKEAYDQRGRRLKPSHRIRSGETFVIRRPPMVEPESPQDFELLYEDDELYVIDKPPLLAVHPSARFHKNTVTWLLRERFGESRPKIVHRLDRETSGILVCAKNKEAERSLKQQFERREILKEYHAIVEGDPEFATKTVDIPLGPALNSEVRIRIGRREDSLGQPALTDFCVRSRYKDCALVEARPKTGRQHQIRVHLALIGHPVVGDKIYGTDERIFIDFVEGSGDGSLLDGLELPRHALHAARVILQHPSSQRQLNLESPLPTDMRAYLEGRVKK